MRCKQGLKYDSKLESWAYVGGSKSRPTVEQIKNGQIKLESDEPSDMKVRVYGNTAVVTGKANIKGTIAGKDASGTVAFTRVWVKKGGKWMTVALQQTKME